MQVVSLAYVLLLEDDAHGTIGHSRLWIGAPASWGSEDWQRMGLTGAAILGTGLLLDRPIRNASQRHQNRTLGRVTDFFERFGSQRYSYGLLGGFYLAGAINNNPKAMHVAQDGLASSLITSDVLAGALVGSLVANSVVTFNQQQRASKVSFTPIIGPNATGVAIQVRF